MFCLLTSLNTIAMEHIADEEYEDAVAVLRSTLNELSNVLLTPDPIPEQSPAAASPKSPRSSWNYYHDQHKQHRRLQQQASDAATSSTTTIPPERDARLAACWKSSTRCGISLDYTHYKYYFLKGNFDAASTHDDEDDDDMSDTTTTSTSMSISKKSASNIGDEDDFYKLVVVISCDEALLDTNDPFMTSQEHCICTIATLYNLGLAYQLWWYKKQQDRSNKNPLLLLRALEAYTHVWEVLQISLLTTTSPSLSSPLNSSSTTTTTTTTNRSKNSSSPRGYYGGDMIPPTLFPVLMAVCTNGIYCIRELWADQALANEWNGQLCHLIAFMDKEIHLLRQERRRSNSSIPPPAMLVVPDRLVSSTDQQTMMKENHDREVVSSDEDQDDDMEMSSKEDSNEEEAPQEEEQQQDPAQEEDSLLNYKADCRFFRLKAFHNSFDRISAQAA